MFLLNYDLYDLHALITFFRNNPAKLEYFTVIEQVIKYIDAEQTHNGIEPNTIRKILKPYIETQEEQLSWVFVENKYTANMFIIKNEPYLKILSSVFKEIALCLKDNSNRVYLLCDSSHNIPLLLADEKKPKKEIISIIKPYREKYNKKYLNLELELL